MNGINPIETLRTISIWDPALDHSRISEVDLDGYQQRRELALVEHAILPGSAPTYYTLRPIPKRLFHRFVMLGSSTEDRHQRAFLSAIQRIENAVDQATGQRHHEYHPKVVPIRDLQLSIWEDACLDMVPPDAVRELGMLAFELARLSPGQSLFFEPPPGWSAEARRRARGAEIRTAVTA